VPAFKKKSFIKPLDEWYHFWYHNNMSKRDKLIQKIMKFGEISCQEAEKVLLSLGYDNKYPNGGSSHVTFRKDNSPNITLVATQKPLKRYLIEKIQNAILMEENK
jgi:predicted RNA binding protein YcfA (HicA-like mRNA interferase family)